MKKFINGRKTYPYIIGIEDRIEHCETKWNKNYKNIWKHKEAIATRVSEWYWYFFCIETSKAWRFFLTINGRQVTCQEFGADQNWKVRFPISIPFNKWDVLSCEANNDTIAKCMYWKR